MVADRIGEIPENLRYSEEHEWLRREGNSAYVGITDYAQSQLGDVVYVDLPKAGTKVSYMAKMGEIESVKAVSELYSPVSGEVVEINTALQDTPELVNREPYMGGWLVRVELSDSSEIDKLLDAKAYQELVQSEIEGHQ